MQCFETKISNKHARLLLDNSTAVACINNMGTSHSVTCNQMAFSIWLWCRDSNVWVSAAHIPGKENTAADAESRKINLDAEWKLDKAVLEQALAQLQASPSIDLFASRLNNQRRCCVSYRADPEAHAVDAFSLSWTVLDFYAFPPFRLITRVLQKVKRDRSTGVIIVPTWPTQVWWPVLMKMVTGKPVQLASKVTLLTAQPPGEGTPTASTPEATGMQDLRSRYQQQGYSRRAADLLLNFLRPSTQKVYNTYIHKWKCYTRLNNIDSMSPSEAEVANPVSST